MAGGALLTLQQIIANINQECSIWTSKRQLSESAFLEEMRSWIRADLIASGFALTTSPSGHHSGYIEVDQIVELIMQNLKRIAETTSGTYPNPQARLPQYGLNWDPEGWD